MKAVNQASKTTTVSRANAVAQYLGKPTKTLVDNRPQMVAQRKLQAGIIDRALGLQPIQRTISLAQSVQDKFPDISKVINLFKDVELVKNDGVNLRIEFGNTPGSHAETRMVMGDSNDQVLSFKALVAENKEKKLGIEIIISNKYNTLATPNVGDLYETMMHEWELHGRQFAKNIYELKSGASPHTLIDHGDIMGESLIAGIESLKKEFPDLAESIDEAYKSDVEHHNDINLSGWNKADNKNLKGLYKHLNAIRGAYSIAGKILPITEAEKAYEKSLLDFIQTDVGFLQEKCEGNQNIEMMYFEVDDLSEKISSLFKELINMNCKAIPSENEAYNISRKQVAEHFGDVLYDLSKLLGACKQQAHN